jgi:hypothetical protein
MHAAFAATVHPDRDAGKRDLLAKGLIMSLMPKKSPGMKLLIASGI